MVVQAQSADISSFVRDDALVLQIEVSPKILRYMPVYILEYLKKTEVAPENRPIV